MKLGKAKIDNRRSNGEWRVASSLKMVGGGGMLQLWEKAFAGHPLL